MRTLLVLITFALGCEWWTTAELVEKERPARSHEVPNLRDVLAKRLLAQRQKRESAKPVKEADRTRAESTPATVVDRVDPLDDPLYDGWRTWCEPETAPCKKASDCAKVVHPSDKPLKCVRPWYAKGTDLKVCSPGWSTRDERAHQRARIRELVRLQFSGELDACAGDDPDWHCGQTRARGTRLASLLNMVAQRETTMRSWKRHRLNEDVKASRQAFGRTAKLYPDNPHRSQRWRWEYGIGLYGMNASLFTRTWDPGAPPEVLCRDVESTAAYLRSTRKAWRKLSGGIDCDGDGKREWHGVGGKPTWYDLHHYASGGKLCPSDKSKRKFEVRVKSSGLAPYAHVSLAQLGTPIDRDGQITTANALRLELDAFSQTWLVQRAKG